MSVWQLQLFSSIADLLGKFTDRTESSTKVTPFWTGTEFMDGFFMFTRCELCCE
jgi:hypothetical protein